MSSFTNKDRKKADEPVEVVTVEPNRRSLLDVLENNFRLANRKIFVHRVIYAGVHQLAEPSEIANIFEDNVHKTNSLFHNECLSGILLYYDNYYCHIVEGGEDTLHNHISILFKEHSDDLKEDKVLIGVHHIQARFLKTWISYYAKPPILVENIDPNSNLEESMRYIKNCAEKLYNFANDFVNDHHASGEQTQEEEIGIEKIAMSKSAISRSMTQSSTVAKDPYLENLPELKLLDFIINCKHLKSLKYFDQYYGFVSEPDDYNDRVWPISCDFIPYDVFDKPFEPIPDLPIGKVEEEEEVSQSGEPRESVAETVSQV